MKTRKRTGRMPLARLCLLMAAGSWSGAVLAQFVPDAEYAAQPALASINADAAYNLGITGAGTLIGVIDSGINPAHQEFNGAIAAGYNFFLGTDVLSDSSPAYHGSYVAAVAGARRDGAGMMGVAYDAGLVIGATDFTSDQLAAAIDFAVAEQVNVLNNSWGYEGSTILSYDRASIDASIPQLVTSFQNAVANNTVVVFANGNDGYAQPQLFGGLPYYYPELQKSWITVVASTVDGVYLTPYSNRCGVAVAWCVVAPGGYGSYDGGIYSVDGTTTDGYQYLTGVSMAASMVSGSIALLAQRFPYMTAEQLTSVLLTTAQHGTDTVLSPLYGRGLIDIAKAMNGPAAFEFTFDVDTQGFDSVWSNNIIGTGGLVKRGDGTLELTGNNTFTGGVGIAGGVLRVSADSNLGDASGELHLDGGTLQAAADMSLLPQRQIWVDAGNGTIDTQNYQLTIPGALQGSGVLHKTGSGTLTLTGNNSYQGGTVIEAGNLEGNTGSLQGVFSGSGTLVFNQDSDGDFSGDVNNLGALEKQGAGLLRLTTLGNSVASTNVYAGILQIDGALASPVYVGNGATLAGHGSVIGNIDIAAGGHLQVGGSTGTPGVTGNLSIASGATFNMAFDALTPTSPLNTTGTITLNGGNVVITLNGDFPAFTRLDLLQSQQSLQGTFDTVSINQLLLRAVLEYDNDSVTLVLAPLNNALQQVQGFNRQQTAAGLTAAVSSGFPPDIAAQINALNQASPAAVAQALDTVSGEVLADTAPAVVRFLDALALSSFLDGHAGSNRAAQTSFMLSGWSSGAPQFGFQGLGDASPDVWVNTIGQRSVVDDNGDARGYSFTQRLLAAGVASNSGDGLALGLMLAQGDQELQRENLPDRSESTITIGGGYGRFRQDGLELAGMMQAGIVDTHNQRWINVGGTNSKAVSDSQQNIFALSISARHQMLDEPFVLSPVAALNYIHMSSSAFSESGNSAFNLSVASEKRNILTSEAGVALQFNDPVMPDHFQADLSLLWRHDFTDQDEYAVNAGFSVAPAATFEVRPAGTSSDSVLLRAGLAYRFSQQLKCALAMQAEMGSGIRAGGLSAGVNYAW